MTDLDFNFSNALSHFRRTGGPKGFVWKFAIAYGLLNLILQVVSLWMQWPVYEIYVRMFTEGGGNILPYTEEINRATMRNLGASILIIPFGLLLWTVFEAASQRRYMRAEGFQLKIGADEGRIAVVGLIWSAVLIGWYIAFAIGLALVIVAGAIGGQTVAIIAAIIGALVGIGLLLWLSARLSPAAALTIRDRQIRFFEAWKVTKGRAGTLIAAGLLGWLVLGALMTLIMGVPFFVALSQFAPLMGGDNASAQAVTDTIRQPAFLVPLMLGVLLSGVSYAFAQHVMSGPPALAAKADPSWIGHKSVSEAFT